MRTLVEPGSLPWTRSVSRREALQSFGVLALGAFVGCTPLRLALRTDRLREGEETEETLRAFVTTVIPLANAGEPHLTRAFYDEDYGFRRCCGFFVKDLRRRAERRFAGVSFPMLSADRREEIVQSGLAAGGLTGRVYAGAAFLAQVAYYGGIYDSARGCPAIDFRGRNRGFGDEDLTYPDAARFLGTHRSGDGNPS